MIRRSELANTRSRKKEPNLKKAKKAAADAFSAYIRIRDSVNTTGGGKRVQGKDGRGYIPDSVKGWQALCCTCGKSYPVGGVGCIQAGHFVPGRGNGVLLDERGCHAQCYNCNIRLKGNWPEYYRFMLSRYGQGVIDELLEKSRKPFFISVSQYEELELLFKRKTALLTQSL